MKIKDMVAKSVMMMVLIVVMPLTLNADVDFGEEVTIESHETVNKAVSFGEEVNVKGTVEHEAISFGDDVIVEDGGRVEGNVISFGGDIIVHSDGEIFGDATSVGGEIRVYPGGVIRGEQKTMGNLLPFLFSKSLNVDIPTGGFMSGIGSHILIGPLGGLFGIFGGVIMLMFFLLKQMIALAFAAFVTFMFPESVSRMATSVRDNTLKAVLLGMVMLILIPILFLFFLVTIIGIPLIPLLAVVLFFSYLVGTVGVALSAGRFLPNSESRSIMSNTLLGVLIIGFLKLIPVIGFLTGIIVFTSSFGVILLTRSSGKSQS